MSGRIIFALACLTVSGINAETLTEESLDVPTRLLAELLLAASPAGIARAPTSFQASNSQKYGPSFIEQAEAAGEEIEGLAAMYADLEKALEGRDFAGIKEGEVATGTVVAFTENGGAMLDLGTKSNALLAKDDLSLDRMASAKASDLFEIGQEIQVVVKRHSDTVIDLSRRSLLRDQIWQTMRKHQEEGTIFDVDVAAVNKGGIIASVDGLRGFIPGSHLSSGQRADESWVGTKLPCKVLDIDGERLLLSNRMAAEESMRERVASLKPDTLVEGVANGIKPYGVFVTLDDGPSGLLHISQISKARVSMDQLPLQPGDRIKAVIQKIDSNLRVQLNTAMLEKEPGDMLKDPQAVFATAEDSMVEILEGRAKEEERRAKAEAELLAFFEDE